MTSALALKSLAGERALILNWRGPGHPQEGGAEVFVWEIAQRLARAGVEVTLFTARVPGLAADETVDGIRVVRRGGVFSVYLRAALFMECHQRKYGAIVDCQNGIPFFAPLFAPQVPAIVCVIHHVHQEQFAERFNPALAWVGRALEGWMFRHVYRDRPVAAVSPSTRAEARLRLKVRGPIYVVPNAVRSAAPPLDKAERRSPFPHIVYVGRLMAHKRVHLLLEAAAQLRERRPELRVDIAGAGTSLPSLERYSLSLGLDDRVTFHGHVPDAKRRELLDLAWLTVIPSAWEGWGISIVEANAAGVPALGFRVRGVVDSIQQGSTGWMIGEDESLADAVDRALRRLGSAEAARAWAQSCWAWAMRFDWEDSARRLAGIIREEQKRRHGAVPRPTGDSASVVEVDSERFAEVAHLIRSSDLWEVRGSTAKVLLHGVDEQEAVRLLEGLGLVGEARVRVAVGRDLVLGPGQFGGASSPPGGGR